VTPRSSKNANARLTAASDAQSMSIVIAKRLGSEFMVPPEQNFIDIVFGIMYWALPYGKILKSDSFISCVLLKCNGMPDDNNRAEILEMHLANALSSIAWVLSFRSWSYDMY
jgi:hypothetical protein